MFFIRADISISEIATTILSQDTLSLLFSTFVPGFLACITFQFIINEDYKKIDTISVILSIAISYLLNAVLKLFNLNNVLHFILLNLIAILLAIIFAVIYIILINTSVISRSIIDNALKHVILSFHSNEIKYIDIYMKNSDIMLHGQIHSIDEGKNPDFAICNYIICKVDKYQNILEYSEKNKHKYLLVRNENILYYTIYNSWYCLIIK